MFKQYVEITKRELSDFTKQIVSVIEKSGHDEDLIHAIMYHLEKLKKSYGRPCLSADEYVKRLSSIRFINQLSNWKRLSFDTDVDEYKAFPVPVVPVENFCKPPDSYRKKVFLECLDDFDILECCIDNITKYNYTLRVCHQFGVPRVLDDLKIFAYMPKNKRDKKIYHLNDFVRVVVCKINRKVPSGKDPEIWVTHDDSSLDNLDEKPKLGLINRDDLPFYVFNPPNPDVFPTYADYIKSHSQFNRLNEIENLLTTAFGVEPCSVFSFHSSLDNYQVPEEDDPEAQLLKSKLCDARNLLNLAVEDMKKDKVDEAIDGSTKAIDICPAGNPLASMLFLMRSQMRGLKALPKMDQRALEDIIEARRLNPDERVNKILSENFSRAALIFYHRKDYERALKYVRRSLVVFKENKDALRLQEILKKKMPLEAMKVTPAGIDSSVKKVDEKISIKKQDQQEDAGRKVSKAPFVQPKAE